MTDKPRIAAWGTFYNGTMQDFAYNKEGAERSASLDFHNRNLSIEPLIRLADHEAALAGLRADRDQQYDMKVKAREQRDAVTSARAADKAQIAELGEALAYALADFDAWVSHENNHPHEHLVAWSDRARAALAKSRGEA